MIITFPRFVLCFGHREQKNQMEEASLSTWRRRGPQQQTDKWVAAVSWQPFHYQIEVSDGRVGYEDGRVSHEHVGERQRAQ